MGRRYITETKKFGGKVYKYSGLYLKRGEAEKAKMKLKGLGYNVRVVKLNSSSYEVYYR